MFEDGQVDILEPITNEVIKHCFGPTAEGGCPLASPDGVAFCHGCRIERRRQDRSTGISGFHRHLNTARRRGVSTLSATESVGY